MPPVRAHSMQRGCRFSVVHPSQTKGAAHGPEHDAVPDHEHGDWDPEAEESIPGQWPAFHEWNETGRNEQDGYPQVGVTHPAGKDGLVCFVVEDAQCDRDVLECEWLDG